MKSTSESAVRKTDISDFKELAYIWEIASTQRLGSGGGAHDIEWDRAKCLVALERIAKFSEDLAEKLLGPKALDDVGLTFEADRSFQALRREFAPYTR